MRRTIYSLKFCLAVLAASAVFPEAGRAEDKIYICSISEARECTSQADCKAVELEEILVAPLIVYDLEKKAIVSAAMRDHGREEKIAGIHRTPSDLIIYGHGDDEVWNTIISLKDGTMTGNINSGDATHILFGHCAPNVYPR